MPDRRRPDPPKSLPGFEDASRFWDRRNRTHGVKVGPGEFYVTRSDETLATVLGSCIAACVHDVQMGVGGMNHFMLPMGRSGAPQRTSCTSDENRYGNHAMEHLVNEVVKHGGRRSRLQVKVFGGARILQSGIDIGASNVEFVFRYLANEGLDCVARDVGGNAPRKLLYTPKTGRVLVRRMQTVRADVEADEQRYLDVITETPVAGEIELFS